jgi:hypothetical protein
LENSLIGLKYDKNELLKNQNVIKIDDYFTDFDFEEYINYLV